MADEPTAVPYDLKIDIHDRQVKRKIDGSTHIDAKTVRQTERRNL